MRVRSALLFVVLAALPIPAAAQVLTNCSRAGSPRANDPGSGGSVSISLPIGLRDCPSEIWTCTATYTSTTALTSLSWWAGTDSMVCGTSTSRYPVAEGNAECWELTSPTGIASPPTSGSFTVAIPSRYIVDPLTGNCANATADTLLSIQGGIGTSYVTLLGFPPSDSNIIGTPNAFPYDVTPLAGPDGVTASPGESQANISWSYSGNTLDSIDGGTAAPTNLVGFWLLCDTNGVSAADGGVPATDIGTDIFSDIGMDGATDAASGGRPDIRPIEPDIGFIETDAGFGVIEVDAGVVTGPACGTPAFLNIDTNDDTQFNAYLCPGQTTLIGASATSGVATGLTNFVTYRFAVVAQDTAGNRSIMAVSNNCVTPVPVTSFWDEYRADGGQALPGYCTAQPWYGGHASAFPWTFLGMLGVVSTVRRHRRKKAAR